jgi:CubicO group peptidase (beta-lactamase class C family)
LKHFLLAIPLSICAVSIAAPPPDFDTRAETLRKQVGAPGMAIAIVENGKVTFAKGYGVKKLGAADAIDADTIFPTGSTGKAFTVADLAILIEKSELPFVAREKVIADIAHAVYDYFLFADLAQSK